MPVSALNTGISTTRFEASEELEVVKFTGSPLNVAATVYVPPGKKALPGSRFTFVSKTALLPAPTNTSALKVCAVTVFVNVKVTVLVNGMAPAPGSGLMVAVSLTDCRCVEGLSEAVTLIEVMLARIFVRTTFCGLL